MTVDRDKMRTEGSEIHLPPETPPWCLVERYVAHYPGDWRLVFRRGEAVIDVPVPEEVWRAFDREQTRPGGANE